MAGVVSNHSRLLRAKLTNTIVVSYQFTARTEIMRRWYGYRSRNLLIKINLLEKVIESDYNNLKKKVEP